jgi:hypothetical protein
MVANVLTVKEYKWITIRFLKAEASCIIWIAL